MARDLLPAVISSQQKPSDNYCIKIFFSSNQKILVKMTYDVQKLQIVCSNYLETKSRNA